MNVVCRMEWPRLFYQCQFFTGGSEGLGLWDAVPAGFRAVLRCLDEIEDD
jgi:hypothetical protein